MATKVAVVQRIGNVLEQVDGGAVLKVTVPKNQPGQYLFWGRVVLWNKDGSQQPADVSLVWVHPPNEVPFDTVHITLPAHVSGQGTPDPNPQNLLYGQAVSLQGWLADVSGGMSSNYVAPLPLPSGVLRL